MLRTVKRRVFYRNHIKFTITKPGDWSFNQVLIVIAKFRHKKTQPKLGLFYNLQQGLIKSTYLRNLRYLGYRLHLSMLGG